GCETEFLKRVAGHKHQYIYVPSARVRHVVRPDQITMDWLLSRAEKLGRGQVYLVDEKKFNGLRIQGIPLKMLLALSRTRIRYSVYRILGMRRHYLDHLMKYEKRRATISEFKEMIKADSNH